MRGRIITTGPVLCHDGIAPEDIEPIRARFPRDPVLLYADGIYAASAAERALFARGALISVLHGYPRAAGYARILDVERFDATTADIEPFCAERARVGHDDATIYADLSTIATLPIAVARVVPRWLVAWWWGRPGYPSRALVHQQLPAPIAAVIPAERIWGCQYANGSQWDDDVVYGPPDFTPF